MEGANLVSLVYHHHICGQLFSETLLCSTDWHYSWLYTCQHPLWWASRCIPVLPGCWISIQGKIWLSYWPGYMWVSIASFWKAFFPAKEGHGERKTITNCGFDSTLAMSRNGKAGWEKNTLVLFFAELGNIYWSILYGVCYSFPHIPLPCGDTVESLQLLRSCHSHTGFWAVGMFYRSYCTWPSIASNNNHSATLSIF